MSEDHRKYQLAVSYASYPASKKISLTEVSDGKETYRYSPLGEMAHNMFNNNFEMRLRKLEMQAERNYEVVGYKHLQEISLRLDRKKNLVHSGTKEAKRTCPSRGSVDKNNQQYLTKHQVIARFSPHLTPTSRSHKGLNSKPCLKKQNSSLRAIRKYAKRQAGVSFAQKDEQFSLAKVRSKMEDYQLKWKRQVQMKRKLTKKPRKYIQPTISSVIQSVDQYRIVSEDRAKVSLGQRLRNMTPSMWEKLLRNPVKTLQSTPRQMEHIQTSGALRSVGHAKYNKQLMWIEAKDREGYFFKREDTEEKLSKR